MAPVQFYRKPLEAGDAAFSVLVAQLALSVDLGASAQNRRTGLYDAATERDVGAFYAKYAHVESDGLWYDWGWDMVADTVQAHPAWVAMTAAQQNIDAAPSVGDKIARVAYQVFDRWRLNVHYAEVRPYPVNIVAAADSIILTDCSGFAEDCYKIGGGPDPSALGFSGAGNTITQWAHGDSVSVSDLEPGDLVFYDTGVGEQPGHVAIYYGEILGTQMVVSNGEYPMQFIGVDLPGSGLTIMGARRYI